MPSVLQRTSDAPTRRFRARRTRSAAALAAALAASAGCAHVENYWREDGPARTAAWDSPSAADLLQRFPVQTPRARGWPQISLTAVSGSVTHGPLYGEDPFVDKGAGNGRFDEFGTGEDAYRIGWEDYLALPYCFARHTLNWLAIPVSAAITPPWTEMASDGRVSRQALGYDHDARRAASTPDAPPPDASP